MQRLPTVVSAVSVSTAMIWLIFAGSVSLLVPIFGWDALDHWLPASVDIFLSGITSDSFEHRHGPVIPFLLSRLIVSGEEATTTLLVHGIYVWLGLLAFFTAALTLRLHQCSWGVSWGFSVAVVTTPIVENHILIPGYSELLSMLLLLINTSACIAFTATKKRVFIVSAFCMCLMAFFLRNTGPVIGLSGLGAILIVTAGKKMLLRIGVSIFILMLIFMALTIKYPRESGVIDSEDYRVIVENNAVVGIFSKTCALSPGNYKLAVRKYHTHYRQEQPDGMSVGDYYVPASCSLELGVSLKDIEKIWVRLSDENISLINQEDIFLPKVSMGNFLFRVSIYDKFAVRLSVFGYHFDPLPPTYLRALPSIFSVALLNNTSLSIWTVFVLCGLAFSSRSMVSPEYARLRELAYYQSGVVVGVALAIPGIGAYGLQESLPHSDTLFTRQTFPFIISACMAVVCLACRQECHAIRRSFYQ